MSALKFSVIILTRNEEQDLPGCLESLKWCDDIHVFDSFSDDQTVEIALAHGAHVTQRAFDNWSAHQNWGLRNIPFKYEWVYYSDADERVTPELAQAMADFVASQPSAVACRVRRRDYYMGAWLKYVSASPFNIRLFKPKFIRYERLTNPVTIVEGEVADLPQHFDHFPFSKGMTHWINKHNNYSTFEARQIIANQDHGNDFSILKAFLSRDRSVRRYNQKELYYRLPFRPVIMFIAMYVLRFGFLDGRAGFSYSLLRAIYEYFIVLKVREIRNNRE